MQTNSPRRFMAAAIGSGMPPSRAGARTTTELRPQFTSLEESSDSGLVTKVVISGRSEARAHAELAHCRHLKFHRCVDCSSPDFAPKAGTSAISLKLGLRS